MSRRDGGMRKLSYAALSENICDKKLPMLPSGMSPPSHSYLVSVDNVSISSTDISEILEIFSKGNLLCFIRKISSLHPTVPDCYNQFHLSHYRLQKFFFVTKDPQCITQYGILRKAFERMRCLR